MIGATCEIVFAFRRRHAHAFHGAVVTVHRTHARFIADFHAVLFSQAAELLQHAGAAADRMDVMAAGQVELALDLGHLFGFPADADILHPVHRGIRLIDETFGEHRIDPALRDVIEVVEEMLPGIGRDLHAAINAFVDLREERAQLLGAGMHETKADMGKLRIAPGFVLGSLFDHDDLVGAGLPRGDRGLQRRAAPADHDDVATFAFHVVSFPSNRSL